MRPTPGRWTTMALHVLTQDARFTVADCGVSDLLPIEEMRANARAISALPDLLQHGKALVKALEGLIDDLDVENAWADLIAAIAKAEGR